MKKEQNLAMEFDEELTHCPLCNSEKIKPYTTDYKGIGIFKCRSCKVKFMNPQYTHDYLNKFYASYQQGDTSHHIYGSNDEPRKALHEYNIKNIEKYIKPGNFLSIGSGNTFDIQEANKRGWNAEGIDMDEKFIQMAIKEYGVNMKWGDFLKHDYPKNHFSCIYMNHVLEHPKEPGEYLDKINELLVRGGVLYISCPNINAWSVIIKRLLEATGIKKKNKGKYYDTWQHLMYFNPGYLKKFLEKKYNFKVRELTNDVKIEWDSLEPKNSMLPFLHKSAFRMIVQKM